MRTQPGGRGSALNDIHIRTWPGDPDRLAVALHCMMGSSAGWASIAQLLGGRVQLRAFDAPSHGRSRDWQPRPGTDYHTAVTEIARELMGDGPVDLIGHSLGATVALRIAVEAPWTIRTLTLIEPVLFAADPARADVLGADLRAAAAAGDMAEATRLFLDDWGGPGGLLSMPAARREAAVRQMPLIIETDDALAADVHDILRPGGLEAIDAPTMLIRGDRSPPVIAAIAHSLSSRISHARCETVTGAGHMLPLTHPAAVAELIGANLDRA